MDASEFRSPVGVTLAVKKWTKDLSVEGSMSVNLGCGGCSEM